MTKRCHMPSGQLSYPRSSVQCSRGAQILERRW